MSSRADFIRELSSLSPKQVMLVAARLHAQLDEHNDGAVAIIGMAGTFPGSGGSLEGFWRLQQAARAAVTEIPASRWLVDEHFDPNPDAPGKSYARLGAFLDDVQGFDASFFEISPREALRVDPQQRLLLETAWQALESAGIPVPRLSAMNAGVAIGISGSEYFLRQLDGPLADIDAYMGGGSAPSVAAGRLSYALNLSGPCIALDTACSSSLVAIHQACEMLRRRAAGVVLAGGVNVMVSPVANITLARARMLAPDGRCKTFDAAADGYGRGEGCGVVVLRRLSDALRDGDRVLAVLRGTAINHDGRSAGLTVPRGPAQEAVIRQALASAGVLADAIDYVEAHGTGTALGDPIEIGALDGVFGRDRERPLLVGSVKTNIGHLEAAAGVAGLIKVVLSLQAEALPPHLHLEQPNPMIDWERLAIQVVKHGAPWPRGERRRIAGVSSFGMSGTNAHAIVEEAPALAAPPPEAPRAQLLALSAKTEAALEAMVDRYRSYLAGPGADACAADIAFTAGAGRTALTHRLTVIGDSAASLAAELLKPRKTSIASPGAAPRIAFLFTGQGSQAADTTRELYASEPVFKAALDRCDEVARAWMTRPLLEILHGSDATLIDQTVHTQPALFAVGYALAELWASWGVQPGAVLGHSVGEYAAACRAGVFSLEDAMKLVCARGRLMQALPERGAMAAIFAAEETVAHAMARVPGKLAIAGLNAADQTVVSGEERAIEALTTLLRARDVRVERLNTSHAFHSPLVDPMLADLRAVAASIRYAAPALPIVSNLTGCFITHEIATPDYWVRHARAPVRFADGIATLVADGCDTYVELGPRPVLLGLARPTLEAAAAARAPSLLPSIRPGRPARDTMLEVVAELYRRGHDLDWRRICGVAARKIALPSYPFQRRRHWVDTEVRGGRADRSHSPAPPVRSLLGPRTDVLGEPAQHVFQAVVSRAAVPWLDEHRVRGTPVVPAAAFLDLALAAGASVTGVDALALVDVVIEQPLVVDGDDELLVQIALVERGGTYAFEIHSVRLLPDGARQQRSRHVTGTLERASTPLEPSVVASESPARAWEALDRELSGDELQASFADVGLEYAGHFRSLRAVRVGRGRSLARLAPHSDAGEHLVHPGLLDSAFQGLAVALVGEAEQGLFLPVGFERVTLRAKGRALWSDAAARPTGSESELLGDLRLLDADGSVLVEVTGMKVRRVSQDTTRRPADSDTAQALYEASWRVCPVARRSSTVGTVVLLGGGDLGASLHDRLTRDEVRAVHIDPRRGPEGDDLDERLRALLQAGHDVSHVVDLRWAAPGEDPDSDPLALAQRRCIQALATIRTVLASGSPPRVVVVTRQANAVVSGEPADPFMAPLWGLGRVLAFEHAELASKLIDLAAGASLQRDAEVLTAEVLAGDQENQVAWRAADRHVLRLRRLPALPRDLEVPRDTTHFRLAITTYGVLENLTLRRLPAFEPAPDQVKIEVVTAGLNFRDVLNALGMLKEASERLGILSEADLPFGGECSGRVVAVGRDVSRFQVGQEVMAIMALGSVGSFVAVDQRFVTRKPRGLSHQEAATIPGAFLTAWYGLCELARIGPGDRVLIHAAAGGVGQAAVQIARWVGAEVFATASPAKWPALRAMGVQHVFSSRNLDFAEHIARLTHGAGVTLVLNSLNNDFVQKSMDVLAHAGRFVELGKLGVWTPQQAHALRPDVAFLPFDLGEDVALRDPAAITRMLATLVPLFERGELQPLPRRSFPIVEAPLAFRHMAQAKHIGKVVIDVEAGRGDTRPAGLAVSADGGYVITGGLGALGLEVARHLADRGARHLLLIGRSAASAPARAVIDDLRARGLSVTTAQTDIADREALSRLLDEARSQLPLRGVIHAAGVLDDGMLLQLDAARLDRVLAPKVAGGWNLHLLTREDPLDFFVCFSSMAAIFGSPGQGNYAAANAFLDALAHHRRSLGLPALTIDWGAWADVGMAAALGDQARRKQEARGLPPLAPAFALRCLTDVADERRGPQVGVFRIEWGKFLAALPGPPVPLFEAFQGEVAETGRHDANDWPADVEQMPAAARVQALTRYLRSQLAGVLGAADTSDIDPEREFSELGLDSLMAVEMTNRLQARAGERLPLNVLFRHSSVAKLAAHLAERPGRERSDGQAAARAQLRASDSAHLRSIGRRLDDLIRSGEEPALDAAALVTIDGAILASTGLSWAQLQRSYLSGRPTLTTVFSTQEGRLGIYSLPRLSSHVYDAPRGLIDECRIAIADAASLGARCVSLTGLIPSATRYGEAIADLGPLPALVSTGHGTTSAAVVLSLLRALECSGRRLEQESVGFVGLGSIGRSVLRLMLKRLPHPRAITLSDVYSKSGSLAELERELRTRFEFRGALEIAMGGPRAAPGVYHSSVIVCATNAPDVLEIASLKPGTIIVDDSAPHCFDITTAMQRIAADADILVTEGGMIRLPTPTTQLLYWPDSQELAGSEDMIRAVLARDPRELMGCMYSSLISARASAIAPTLGLVDLESSVANFDYFRERGIQGANLHCEDVPIHEEAIASFARKFGASPP